MEQENKAIAVTETPPLAVRLTSEAIEGVKQDIQLCQRLVEEVLEDGVDYGTIEGVPRSFLWDSGASKIMAAFNTYAEHIILRQAESDSGKIAFSIEARLVNRKTGAVVATGLGAASTLEPKYKYRWVENPEEEGYRTREGLRKRGNKYRILNPEYDELVNTILKMAAKRAEVDAAQSLPGVASTLRRMFQPPQAKAKQRKEPDWSGFWGKVRQIGLSDSEVHSTLGITSMKDWAAQGKTLEQALEILLRGSVKDTPKVIAQEPEPIPDELPAPQGQREVAWGIVKGLLKETYPKGESVTQWFAKHFSIKADLTDFALEHPPERFTEQALSRFHDSLLTLKESRVQEARGG